MGPILIIGGGIAGLTTALTLLQKQIDFLVLEAVPEIKGLGAGISLAGNAMKVLQRLNLSEEVKRRGHLISSLVIQDQSGKAISAMDPSDFNREHGLENVAIHRGELHAVLLKNIPGDKIRTGKKAVQVLQDKDTVSVNCEDGTKLIASAVIVADGIRSGTRQQLLPSSVPRYAGYTCWRGVTENKWNLQTHACETWGPAGRIGYVPIGFNQLYWFACKNAAQNDSRMKEYSNVDLARNFSQYVKPIPEILENTRPEDVIWSDIVDLKPIPHFAFNRILLIGDAAHATTPNLGQGACLATEDAACVADEIDKYQSDIPKAFKSFEQKRLTRAHYIVNTSYRLGNVAQLENRFAAGLRNVLFRLIPDSMNESQMKKVLGV